MGESKWDIDVAGTGGVVIKRDGTTVMSGTIDTLANGWVSLNAALATRDARIRELEAALKPFAAMHREEYTKDEIVLMRGIEEDMTVLHSHDFANAAVVLAAKDKP